CGGSGQSRPVRARGGDGAGRQARRGGDAQRSRRHPDHGRHLRKRSFSIASGALRQPAWLSYSPWARARARPLTIQATTAAATRTAITIAAVSIGLETLV